MNYKVNRSNVFNRQLGGKHAYIYELAGNASDSTMKKY